MTVLTHSDDGNVFAKPRRTNIHLIHANMHESRFILIIKMRQLCVQQIVLLVNLQRLTPLYLLTAMLYLDETQQKGERAGFPMAYTQFESKGDHTFFYTLCSVDFWASLSFLPASLFFSHTVSLSASLTPHGAHANRNFLQLIFLATISIGYH